MDFVSDLSDRTKRFSYPCQNAIMTGLRFEVRYRLVYYTKSRYLNASNNVVPFNFDSIQLGMTKVTFHDFWYWHLFRGRIEIQGFPKKKARIHWISSRIQEEYSMKTIYHFFFNRPGTIVKKLNVTNPEALEYCPTMYVSDEVVIWNREYIPIDYYKKIQPVGRLKKATIYQDKGQLGFFDLPLIASAEEWQVYYDLPITIFLASKVKSIIWQSQEIPFGTIGAVYQGWKAEGRAVGTRIQLITNHWRHHLEAASHLPSAKKVTTNDSALDYRVYLTLDDKHLLEVYYKHCSLFLLVITKESLEPRKSNPCCVIL